MGFAGFICCFHLALCSAIFCVAHAADTPIASVTLAVPATTTCCQQQLSHGSCIQYTTHCPSDCIAPLCLLEHV